jgi:hypothetical protein|eukprot:COSAG01_NODE_9097_length_2557_cov_5.644426_4_plen_97_part_00
MHQQSHIRSDIQGAPLQDLACFPLSMPKAALLHNIHILYRAKIMAAPTHTKHGLTYVGEQLLLLVNPEHVVGQLHNVRRRRSLRRDDGCPRIQPQR